MIFRTKIVRFTPFLLSLLVVAPNVVVGQALNRSFEESTNVEQSNIDGMIQRAYIGDGAEQYNLGYHYFYGKGVQRNFSKAKKWFDLASKSESPAARYKIGRLYETGVFYKKDIKQAVLHYEFAASKGEIYALNNLAILYLTGNGVAQDVPKGISLAKRSALKGNAEAQVNLGLVYLNGTGVAVDKVKALQYFKDAAKQLNPEGLYYLAQFHLSLQEYVEAFDYFHEAAKLGHSNSQLRLAMLFDKGLGTEKSQEQSLKWLKESADQGNIKASKILTSINKK